MTTSKKTMNRAAILSASLLIAGGWFGTGAAQSTSNSSSTPSASAASRPSVRYADGTYSARGWYGGLPSSITVTVTLARGVITRVGVQTHATDPTSLDYQRRFAAAVPRVVVGRPVGEVRVGKLAGSSGTPVGFNDALDKIKAQASK